MNIPVMVQHMLNDIHYNGHQGEAHLEGDIWVIDITPEVVVEGNTLRLTFPKKGRGPRVDLVIGGQRRGCAALWQAILLVQGKPLPPSGQRWRTDQRMVNPSPGTRR